MLIDKKVSENDIVAVKLNTGEELVGKLVTQNPLTLAKPIVLGMQQTKTGDIGLGFGPFMLGIENDAKVTIEAGSYITIVKARDEIKQAYIKSTTGLDVPPALIV